MSLAYVLFCLWVLVGLASAALPRVLRGQVRLGLVAAGGALVLLALFTQGVVTAAFALTGVLALFPEPLVMAVEVAKARIVRFQAARAA